MPSSLPAAGDMLALLAAQPVFAPLDSTALRALAAQWHLESTAPGDTLAEQGALADRLGWVIAGTVELCDPDLEHTVHLSAGALFGLGATPATLLGHWQATVAGDGVVAWLPASALQALCLQHPALRYHFASLPAASQMPGDVSDSGDSGDSANDRLDGGTQLNRLAVSVRTLLRRAPICLAPGTSVQAVAAHMCREGVSSVMLAGAEGFCTAS